MYAFQKAIYVIYHLLLSCSEILVTTISGSINLQVLLGLNSQYMRFKYCVFLSLPSRINPQKKLKNTRIILPKIESDRVLGLVWFQL